MLGVDRCRRLGIVIVVIAGCAQPAAQPPAQVAIAAPVPAPPPPPPLPLSPLPGPPPAAAPTEPAKAATTTTPTRAPATTTTTTGRDPVMDQLLNSSTASGALKTVLASPEKYRFQVLYSIVQPTTPAKLERHGYRTDAEYFFPASSMKVPIALAAYERLPVIRKSKPAGAASLTRDLMVRILPVAGSDADPFVTTLARETWRALIVSDNFSANRLLAFVGHREVHETLWSLGLKSARIRTGFATGADLDPAELSPRVEVANGGDEILPARKSNLALPSTDANAKSLDIGEAAIVDGRRVDGPLSFASKNAMRLQELQDTLVRIMRPELLPAKSPADTASKEDLEYLRQALGTLPSASGLAGFDRNVVADYQLSPFLRGIERVRPRARFQLYSKVGQAFGFLVANAYVVDKDTGRSFFLTASVYANPDETMNDDKYAYDSISFPALADIGEAFCRHAFANP